MNLLALGVGDDPPFMYQAQCSCGWDSEETPDCNVAESQGREHRRERRQPFEVPQ